MSNPAVSKQEMLTSLALAHVETFNFALDFYFNTRLRSEALLNEYTDDAHRYKWTHLFFLHRVADLVAAPSDSNRDNVGLRDIMDRHPPRQNTLNLLYF